MPSLPFKSKKKDKAEDNLQAKVAAADDGDGLAPPPAYTDSTTQNGVVGGGDSGVDITAAFANLSLDQTPKDPQVDTCLAHLKLLHAIQSMKEDVGYTDGLWNIWDSRADAEGDIDVDDAQESEALPSGKKNNKRTPDDDRKIRLSKIREKRWALFVARAVDRYEAWWATFPQAMLRENDMVDGSGSVYHEFVYPKTCMKWTAATIPPLDVLMV